MAVNIGIIDIDKSIIDYLNSLNIKILNSDGSVRKVPIVYCTKERWSKVKSDRGLLDAKGSIITPVISLLRSSFNISNESYGILQNPRTHYVKYVMDNNPKSEIINYLASKSKNLNKLSNIRMPLRKYKIYKVAVPRFLAIEYDMNILSSYVSDINSIIEQLIDVNVNRDVFIIPLSGFSDCYITARYNNDLSDLSTYELNENMRRDIIYSIKMSVNGFIMTPNFNKTFGGNYIEIVESPYLLDIKFDD